MSKIPVEYQSDPLATDTPWDFGDYKLHPFWPRDDPTLAIRPGEVLFRGTSSANIDAGRPRSHEWPKPRFAVPEWMRGRPRRIYMSEGAEDAAGYADTVANFTGGRPVLCIVRLDDELFKALKPGYEGTGEWYVELDRLPNKAVRCLPVSIDQDGVPQVPWNRIRKIAPETF